VSAEGGPTPERHRSSNIGWLRAAVLGANDGLISTSSLIAGVAAANAERPAALLAALAGAVAGALSMAAGEYVSVSSQADTERADEAREREELARMPAEEHAELAAIYQERGLSPALAAEVASALMAHDALGAHLRDELGLHAGSVARPLQAALASAAAFAVGAALPVAIAAFVPVGAVSTVLVASTLVLLAVLGGLAARLGGAPVLRGAVRVTFWGAVALGATMLVGRMFGATG
jgi:VIT1/CCC1 family predicted Fe2+/Mn2+ transporter